MYFSSQYHPKSFATNKIPLFNEINFSMWKTKALVVLETIDHDMLDIVNHGPHIRMYQPMVNNALAARLKQKAKESYDEEDKRLISLDVKARVSFGNSLAYRIYHLLQN